MKICIKCGKENNDDLATCSSCNAAAFKHLVSDKSAYNNIDEKIDQYSKFGGWLIVVGVGRVFAPISVLLLCLNYYLTVFNLQHPRLGSIYLLVDKASAIKLTEFLYFRIMLLFIIFIIDIILLYLFFKKKKLFPKAMIAFYIFMVMYSFIDNKVLDFMGVSNVLKGSNLHRNIFMTLIPIFIWVPYLLISKRVKETFIND